MQPAPNPPKHAKPARVGKASRPGGGICICPLHTYVECYQCGYGARASHGPLCANCANRLVEKLASPELEALKQAAVEYANGQGLYGMADDLDKLFAAARAYAESVRGKGER